MGVTTLFAQALHTGKGEVIAVRFLELKPDVNIAEFENFAYKTFNSGFDGAVPGLKEYIAKSDRGMDVGSYSLLMVFDSQIVRDTMIPNRSASDWLNKIMEDQKLWALWNKLDTYVVDGSLAKYNDFVVLR